MKKGLIKWMIIASALVCAAMPLSGKAQGVVSFQVFYDELQHHGTWMQHARHGYVWMPRVGHDFVPYGTNGYWIQTDYGNTWVSDYSWGWAPFHYGRWFYDDFYGWMWVPDTVWGPAWVVWRSGGGYYGWAPLMPGYGIHASANYYHHIPQHYWNFVPYRYITYRRVYTHCVPRTRVVNVIHHTTIVNHNYIDNSRNTFFTGPSRSDIERTTHSRVPVYKINDRMRPGVTNVENSTASFYKPRIENSDSKMKSVPSRFIKPDRNDANVKSQENGMRQFQENKFNQNSSNNKPGTFQDKDTKECQQDFRSFDRYKSMNRMNPDNNSRDNVSRQKENHQTDRISVSRPEYKVERQNSNSMQKNNPSLNRNSFDLQKGNGQNKMVSTGFQKQNGNQFKGNSSQKEKIVASPDSRSSQSSEQPKQPVKRSSLPSRK